ncbi:MAG: lipid-A-disaccharide synthase [Acidiferrobacteraceae bacterium]|jgi:lipid-A-disaccharide synthase
MRIGVVAGEVSGDILGADLIKALRERFPDSRFEGICGARMAALGCVSLFPMERLSVVGISEALARYSEISQIRRDLINHFRSHPPDLFIGIDAPDFNIRIETVLRRIGVPVVHYVSPTVWAWRGYRIAKIRQAVDLMLTLFPFEAKYYHGKGVPVRYVGHPMADEIDFEIDQPGYRRMLRLPEDRTIIALLPGSRESELKAHSDLFVLTAQWLYVRHPDMHFAIPFVSRPGRLLFEEAIKRADAWDVPITRFSGHSREVMAASDAVLVASGTATLEAALLKRPMVVTYKVSPVSALLIRLLSHVTMYALPNHLAGRLLVPELMQKQARPELLGAAIEKQLERGSSDARSLLRTYLAMHKRLRRGATQRAADAIAGLLKNRG